MKMRSSYMQTEEIQLSKAGITIWGYNKQGKAVCRLEINAAGIGVYKRKKQLRDWNWEGMVKELGKRN